jgi:aminoacyl-tRNA hydrolase
MRHTTFIGMTGSTGKTTVKDLVACILERHFKKGCKSIGNRNLAWEVARLVLRTRRSDAFCVTELAVTAPGSFDNVLPLVCPDVGVVTNIGDDHLFAFGNRDAIAREKGKLIRSLPRDGIAILNADDPRVLAMSPHCAGRVVTYGLGEGAHLRGEVIRSVWPDHLALRVTWQGESHTVQTQFCGTFWATAILAALATAVALGVPLALAAAAIADVEPFEARMAPMDVNGVTFLRDDWKAPYWTLAPVFEFIRQARAKRKFIVIGTLSDYWGDSTARYAEAGRLALAAADGVIFVGSRAASGLRARRNGKDALWAFPSLLEASKFLADHLKPGDLVLLKGSNKADHMQRLILAQTTGVGCWRSDCGRNNFCIPCELLHVPSGPADAEMGAAASMALASTEAKSLLAELRLVGGSAAVVVGLGNPGTPGTPHNVGYRAIDLLAQDLGGRWIQVGDLAMVMKGESQDVTICLVKALTQMNRVGPALRSLADEIGFSLAQCIIIHDDMDLPLGKVRARMRGSDGGHRGLRSIMQEYQDDVFRRIKIGVGRPLDAQQAVGHVLTSFRAEQISQVDAACRTAVDRVLELIRQNKRAPVEPDANRMRRASE